MDRHQTDLEEGAFMRQVVVPAERKFGVAPTRYISRMHGEETQIDVFTRISDSGLRSIAMGAMELITLRCGTVSIRREAGHIQPRSNGMSTFILQVRGDSSFRHYGNQIELAEGDFTLCDNGSQYDLRLNGVSEIIMFRVPTASVQNSIPSPNFLCGCRLAGNVGLASTAAAMALDLAGKNASNMRTETSARAGRHLLEVLASSYSAMIDDCSSASALMSGRFWKVKLFIEDNLRDAELSPSLIADRLRLSDRYLRMIFSVNDESPSAYILRRRLEECAAQLRDPHWRHHPITGIAFGWGFNSASHFTRSFRARFLCSPREYRNLPSEAQHCPPPREATDASTMRSVDDMQ
jgi:AraC-like DNA-binding protein